MEKQWIYNAFCYFLYSSGFRSVTAPAIKLINFRSQLRLEEHSIGHFFLMESEQEVSYTVFFKDRKANFVNQLNSKNLLKFPLRHRLNRRSIFRWCHPRNFLELSGEIVNGSIPQVLGNLSEVHLFGTDQFLGCINL